MDLAVMDPPRNIRSALVVLVKTHQAGIWRYLRYLGCDPGLADDLTQEVFLAAIARPFEDRNPASTAAYLRTVARNLFFKSRRGALRNVPPEDEDLEGEGMETTWKAWVADDSGEEYIQALRACLETLPERARKALDLQYREDLPRARIAAELGLSEEGAKSLLYRGKEMLRRCVETRLRHD